ncbi:hypothetical protein AADW31_08990, partial [Campylobacter jejuni]|uniref:hypothetical protein n=1 Tax=Campylobacter jejuni TaxID=197 RepID=UPI00311D3953
AADNTFTGNNVFNNAVTGGNATEDNHLLNRVTADSRYAQFAAETLEWNVGIGGKFTDLQVAINEASKYKLANGYKIVITIEPSYVFNSSIIIENVDLSHVVVTSNNQEINITVDNFTIIDGEKSLFLIRGICKLPIFDKLNIVSSVDLSFIIGLGLTNTPFNYKSYSIFDVLITNSTFKGLRYLVGGNKSRVVIDKCNFTNFSSLRLLLNCEAYVSESVFDNVGTLSHNSFQWYVSCVFKNFSNALGLHFVNWLGFTQLHKCTHESSVTYKSNIPLNSYNPLGAIIESF